jgi:hypothetical protein
MKKTRFGQWLNTGVEGDPAGYQATKTGEIPYFWPLLPTPIHRVTISLQYPLTFLHPDGYALRSPLNVFTTDWGTLPRLAQVFIPKDSTPCTFIFHDIACQYRGLMRAWLSQECENVQDAAGGATGGGGIVPPPPPGGIAVPTYGQWLLVAWSRLQVDELLYLMARAEGANWVSGQAIYRGCRLGVRLGIAKSW